MFLRALFAFLALPGVVALLVPTWIVWNRRPASEPWFSIGLVLLVAGFAVVLAALSLVAYPTIAGRDGAATGPPSPTVPPEAGLQLLGRQGDLADLARQREEVGQGTSAAVAPTDPPTSASSTPAPGESPTSSAVATAVTGRAAGTLGGMNGERFEPLM